ncbi:winged helix-turn-helix domain-containing protein [Streptomyces sp. NPDC013978]|uniref:winged helix-turn-helix domain-containing protein n=1 Tax=Streptomyces sp. NPDC013978 TaxID=3364869 RepID=UPI0036F9BB00
MSDDRSSTGGAVERVLTELRRRIVAQEYSVGSALPSQRELATSFGVSRDTVQRALRELGEDGWIRSRQGSGSRVIKAPQSTSAADGASRMRTVELGWFVERAFAQPDVRLDVYCFTSESLDAHLRVRAERILTERASVPERIRLRMLLPARDVPLPIPRNLADPTDTRVVDRLWGISERCLSSLTDTLNNLRANGPVQELDFTVKRVPLLPTFKTYLLNEKESFQALYLLAQRRIPLSDMEDVEALDFLSVGAIGTYYDKGEDVDDAQARWVAAQQAWFESLWEHLAT